MKRWLLVVLTACASSHSHGSPGDDGGSDPMSDGGDASADAGADALIDAAIDAGPGQGVTANGACTYVDQPGWLF